MAVGAFGEGNRLLEISAGMTFEAIDLRMLSEQLKLCLGVIELRGRWNFLPAARGVAGFAGLRERAVMRIGMAIGALTKRHAGESWRAAWRRWGVALGTSYLDV